jgi:hypothetical protein
MHKKQIKLFDAKNLNLYNNINIRQKLRVKSAYPTLMTNKVIREKNEDIMKMIRYLDRNKRNDIYKN